MASGTITPGFLSGSTSGRQIKVAATGTPGTLLHTAVSGSTSIDIVSLWATNLGVSGDVVLTVEWGGTTNPDDRVEISLTMDMGSVLVLGERRINGGLAIRAFADTADAIMVYGHVDTLEL